MDPTKQPLGPVSAMTVRQASDLTFRSLHVDRVVLAFVRRGCKRIGGPGGLSLSVAEGHWVALTPGRYDIRNETDVNGAYRTDAVAIAPEIAAEPSGAAPMPAQGRTDAMTSQALDHLRQGLAEEAPPEISVHRAKELLILARRNGFSLGPRGTPTMADRVRDLLARDIGRPWRAGEIAAALATSEATLRRHLAADGLSFTRLLSDLRMTRGLELLQSTRLSVTAIAHEVGCASSSRFAADFRSRFDCRPTDIRRENHHRERIRMKVDRDGTATASSAA